MRESWQNKQVYSKSLLVVKFKQLPTRAISSSSFSTAAERNLSNFQQSFSILKRLLEIILVDGRSLKSDKVPSSYIPITQQDPVIPSARKVISVFSRSVEKTLGLPNVQREHWSHVTPGLSCSQPQKLSLLRLLLEFSRLTSNAHSWLPSAHNTWQSLFKKT